MKVAQLTNMFLIFFDFFDKLLKFLWGIFESFDKVEDRTDNFAVANFVFVILDFQFFVDPSLIGGLRIQIGSDVFDGTVKTRLASLENSF